MRASYLDILILAIFVITLIAAYFKKFNAKALITDFSFGMRVIFAYAGAIITYNLIKSNAMVDKLISNILINIKGYLITPAFTAYLMTICIYAISILIIYIILNCILLIFKKVYIKKRVLKIEYKKLQKGEKRAKIQGVIYAIPMALAYCVIVFSVFMMLDVKGIIHISGESASVNTFINNFNSEIVANPFNEYNIDTSSGVITAKSLAQEEDPTTIVYYNGVTLSEAVKSDTAINDMAKQITQGDITDLEKARAIYNWIGNNIVYNEAKAQEITRDNGKGVKSGAIVAFNTKTGVCFDYASLYVAMARAVGLKVRIISGEGYTGTNWGPHAWNEVYIPSEKKWIPVDPTFATTGDYFATNDFYATHRDGKIIGQWN
ncbi:MAG: transglutaminase-like domain-containing protein [Sarcina sp.]